MVTLVIHSLLLLLAILVFAALAALFGFLTEGKNLRSSKRSDSVPAGEVKEPVRAVILCDTVPPAIPFAYENQGFTDCHHANRSFGGFTACPSSCLGLGSCVTVCPSSAIKISDGHISVTDACTGCGKCVESCPRTLIHLLPLDHKGSVKCAGTPISGTADICETGKAGHMIDYREFPESFFKNLDTWGIIRKKSRYE